MTLNFSAVYHFLTCSSTSPPSPTPNTTPSPPEATASLLTLSIRKCIHAEHADCSDYTFLSSGQQQAISHMCDIFYLLFLKRSDTDNLNSIIQYPGKQNNKECYRCLNKVHKMCFIHSVQMAHQHFSARALDKVVYSTSISHLVPRFLT